MSKGIAFPTCISVNSIVGHFTPIADHGLKLCLGDLVCMNEAFELYWLSTDPTNPTNSTYPS
jgi:hypothetical protein